VKTNILQGGQIMKMTDKLSRAVQILLAAAVLATAGLSASAYAAPAGQAAQLRQKAQKGDGEAAADWP
jgi:hypothetical protein